MRNHYPILSTVLLCAALLIAGCADMTFVPGSGNTVREERSVDDFTAVSICCGMHLEFTEGDQITVVLEGDDNLLPDIETVVQDEQLTVRFRRPFTFFSVQRNRAVTAIITAPTLQGLELSGGAEANADQITTDTLHLLVSGGSHINIDTLRVDQLSAELSGGGEIRIDTGTINQQEVDASGGSHYRLEDVQSSSATLDLSGGSEAHIRVSESLHVNASGGSELNYAGSPTVEQNISGGSRVRASNE
jgi:hypothetical protein